MAEVLEQLGKMSREEQLRIAHWILDAIARGDVVRPTKERDGEQVGDPLKDELERQMRARHQLDVVNEIAGSWEDDRTTEEIIADIEGSRTMGREVEL